MGPVKFEDENHEVTLTVPALPPQREQNRPAPSCSSAKWSSQSASLTSSSPTRVHRKIRDLAAPSDTRALSHLGAARNCQELKVPVVPQSAQRSAQAIWQRSRPGINGLACRHQARHSQGPRRDQLGCPTSLAPGLFRRRQSRRAWIISWRCPLSPANARFLDFPSPAQHRATTRSSRLDSLPGACFGVFTTTVPCHSFYFC